MPFRLTYPGGEDTYPDAHTAAQAMQYLDRDGYAPVTIIDPEGRSISRDHLGELALEQFRTPHNA